MRMRHKPYARPELEGWPAFVSQPTSFKNQWKTAFGAASQPLHLELGCGKGAFLAAHAFAAPQTNFLGVDLKNEVLVVAKRNIEGLFAPAGREPDNVRITALQIEQIDGVLGPGDRVHRLYINFCNPWPKAGDAKHRLTHPRQLVKYRDFLVEGAALYFKTDDTPLFQDSLRYFAMTGYEVLWHTLNLHRDEPEWNIRTEHENTFAGQGVPIKACIAVKRPADLDKTAFLRMKDV